MFCSSDSDELGVAYVRIATAAPAKQALRTGPAAVHRVRWEIDQAYPGRGRAGPEQVAAGEPLRGCIPVTGMHRDGEHRGEPRRQLHLACIRQSVQIGIRPGGTSETRRGANGME